MPQEDVEAVRRLIETFNRGDWEGALGRCDSQIEWVIAREHPNTRTLHGVAEVCAYWEEWRETVGRFTFDVVDFKDAGDQVVLLGRMRGQGTASGVEVEVPLAGVATMGGGKVVRYEEYLDRAEALQAAGLSE